MNRIVFTLGTATRETGIALERLGMRLQGDNAFTEQLSRHRRLMNVGDKKPQVGQAFVAPSASVVGDVKIGHNSSVWYSCVLRGDAGSISIGNNSSVQDRVVISSQNSSPTVIGNNVVIGQGAILGSCNLDDECSVGMGAQVLDGAHVQKGAIVASGAVVGAGSVVKSGEMWAGSPAKLLRPVEQAELAGIIATARRNVELASAHAEECDKSWRQIEADKLARKNAAMRDPDYDAQIGVHAGTDAAVRAANEAAAASASGTKI